jgi:hypothetical protein
MWEPRLLATLGASPACNRDIFYFISVYGTRLEMCGVSIDVNDVELCRSQWSRGLMHELSSLARKLGSWVRIPVKAWMSVCVSFVFVCFPVCRQRPCDGFITRPRSATGCVKRSRNWKSDQGKTNGCRGIDRYRTVSFSYRNVLS